MRRARYPNMPASVKVAGSGHYFAPALGVTPVDPTSPQSFTIAPDAFHTQMHAGFNPPLTGEPTTYTLNYEKSPDKVTWTHYATSGPAGPGSWAPQLGRTHGDQGGDGTAWWRLTVWATVGGVDSPAVTLVAHI